MHNKSVLNYYERNENMKKSYNDEQSLNIRVDINLGQLGRMIKFYEANVDKGNYLDRQTLSDIRAIKRAAIADAASDYERMLSEDN
tara:strand:+ start:344 stop:601 length:258 start_codon:yes stop_codon:yes gene_type:complete